MDTQGKTHVTLELFGAFLYVVKEDSLTVLFVDGRRSALASDGKTLIPSHVPVIATTKESVPGTLPEGALVLDDDCKRVLWFLDDQDITIVPDQGGCQTPFRVSDNTRPHPEPVPGEEGYFGWVADMNSVVKDLRLRKDALKRHPKRISARLTLTFGDISCAGCIPTTSTTHKFKHFSFRPLKNQAGSQTFGALAGGVCIDLGTFPSLILKAQPFKGTGEPDTMTIKSGEPDLTITMFNSPVGHIVMKDVMESEPFISHFELFYRLFTNPPYPLLVPFTPDPGPTAHNVSCPPAQVQG
jgi:hypothetical protein